MSRSDAQPGRMGRPRLTSRAQILAAARRLIDQDDWDKLTIRRLAAEIGVGATTLYHHVRDKEDLLVQLLNDYTDQVERPEPPDDPRERVVVVAVALHDALSAWPWAAEVLATDGFVGRLSSSALWMVETIVAGAIDCGCTPEQSVDVFRSIWYYTVGEILVRARSSGGRAGAERPASVAFTNLDAAQVPHLAELGDRWPQLAARDTYSWGLRALVDGMLAPATTPQH